MLGTGDFSLSIFFAEHGYHLNKQELFYTINPKVYVYIPDVLEFKVQSGQHWASEGTTFIAEGEWSFINDLEDSSIKVTDYNLVSELK
jgi:hypothetical protein